MSCAYDCIVLGGSTAASTLAALLAAAGHRTLLVEPAATPRARWGESLLPGSYATLDRLGLVEILRAGPAPSRRGLTIVGAGGTAERFVTGPPAAASWQVASEFDGLLRARAVALGAELRTGATQAERWRGGSSLCGIRLATESNNTELRSRVVVDARPHAVAPATGTTDRAAIGACYENAQRGTGSQAGDSLLLATQDRRAWFWFVPLAGNRVSIGVVGARQHLLGDQVRPESAFEEQLVRCPAVVERLAAARLSSPFQVSREAPPPAASADDQWLRLPAESVGWDPLLSTGLLCSLWAGELAAQAVSAGLSSGDLSAAALGGWIAGFEARQQVLRAWSEAFAIEGFCPLEFVAQYPQQRAGLEEVLRGEPSGAGACPLGDDLDDWIARRFPEQGRQQISR